MKSSSSADPAVASFQHRLLHWFDQSGRKNLPWQRDKTPYYTWLSEIMLQQTQVATVIPYFERMIAEFPNIIALAKADEDRVLYLWSGLGYYARARNLHKTAKIIVRDYAGVFPRTCEALMALPGIGRSTAGAILSIAMQQPTPILDGNVKRVLTRYHAITGWPGSASVTKHLWEIAAQYTSTHRPAAYTQAMMDLGATICQRTRPQCTHCPLMSDCLAYQQGNPTDYPTRRAKRSLPTRKAYLLVIIRQDTQEILLEKRPPIGIWPGLWSLPQCPYDADPLLYFTEKYPQLITKASPEYMPAFLHTFTHFRLHIHPVKLEVETPLAKVVMTAVKSHWYNHGSAASIGLPAPVHRLINLSRP